MAGREKLLITGGLGNLGSWLTMHFSDIFEVYVLSRKAEYNLNANYKIIECDITDIDMLREKLKVGFDYCIHAASYNEFFHDGYAEKALMINSLGTRNLIEVFKDSPLKKFIYLSTFHVYGASSGIINEESPLSPKNDYASTHLFAEYYLKQFYDSDDFPSVIFRLTNSYGAPKYTESSKWYLVLNDLVRSAYESNKIVLKGNGKVSRDFIWMGDVCSILEKSFHFDNNTLLNLSSNKTYSMLELARRVQEVYHHRYKQKISIELNEEDKTVSSLLEVDNSKLLQKIDFEFSDKLDDEINSIFTLLESI